jgi:hypothetical protein
MADFSSQTEPARPASSGARADLDPVSADSFEEIIDADPNAGRRYSIHPQQPGFDLKRSKLGIANWVMAIVAGLVLGVVMTMIAAM